MTHRFGLALVALLGLTCCNTAQIVEAAGVVYADPGWFHAFEGNSDYYHDPDGPNPNYLADPDPTNNQAGGQANQPALIPAANEAAAIWQNSGSQWEGSAPGDPLGGPPGPTPVPAPAPGGVGAFSNGPTTFIRIQDVGQPQDWGWADKGAQGSPTGARQEGNNRRIQFKHEMNRDAAYSDNPAIMDSGVTISFRARIATKATGPLDDMYAEGGGTTPSPWPTDGIGYPVANNGRGMFMLTQTGASGPGQLAFSLLDTNTITAAGYSFTQTGLVMNNRAPVGGGLGSPDTGDSTAATLNMVEIPNSTLTDWHEFWITVKALPAPIDGNTHEVNVYKDGSLAPQTYQIILGGQNEFGSGAHLGMGLSSGTRSGSYDVDFFAYKEGVVAPTLAQVDDADFDNNGVVDGADFLAWQRGFGITAGATNGQGDANGNGAVNSADFDLWKAKFGGAPAMAASGATPEPTSSVLIVVATISAASYRRR
jgi:hypothetical protein